MISKTHPGLEYVVSNLILSRADSIGDPSADVLEP